MKDQEIIKKVADKATPEDRPQLAGNLKSKKLKGSAGGWKEAAKKPDIIQHNKIEESLKRKSEESGFPFDVICEVYFRGLVEGKTQNFAFDRVNSFIAWGKAAEDNADLFEGIDDVKKFPVSSSSYVKTEPPVKLKKEGYRLAAGTKNQFRDDFIAAHGLKSGTPEGLEHFKKTYERLENEHADKAIYRHRETGKKYSLFHLYDHTTKRHGLHADELKEETILEGGNPVNKEKSRAFKAGVKIADIVRSRNDMFSDFGIEKKKEQATNKYSSAVDKGLKKGIKYSDLEKAHIAGAKFNEESDLTEVRITTPSADYKVVKYRKANGSYGWRKIKRFRDIVK